MTRVLVAALGLAFALPAFAIEPPKAMPGDPKAGGSAPPAKTQPPAASRPTGESPPTTAMDESCDDSCCESGCCRRFRRLACLWSGCRYATITPSECGSVECDTPVYCSQVCGRLRTDRRHFYGCGRFYGGQYHAHCCLSRAVTWLCWQPCARLKPHCVCEAYQTPVRYYFGPDVEYGPDGQCCNSGCHNSGNCAQNGGGCGDGSGRSGADGLIRGGGNGGVGVIGGGVGAGGLREHCRNREQCCLTGADFNGTLRFARDHQTIFPPMDAGRADYSGSWHDIRYFKKPPEPSPIQQASVK